MGIPMKKLMIAAVALLFLALPSFAKAGQCGQRYPNIQRVVNYDYGHVQNINYDYNNRVELVVVQPVYEVQAPVDFEKVDKVVEVREVQRVRVQKVNRLQQLLLQINDPNVYSNIQKVIIQQHGHH